MGSCSVYVTSTSCFVFTSHETRDGFGVLAPPFYRGTIEDPSAVGEVIMSALDASQVNFDDSTWNRNEVLLFAGYRTWRAFEREALNFFVSAKDATHVIIVPSTPAPKGGYLHRRNDAKTCRLDANEIGETLASMVSRE